ncbi:Uncharacterised protein [Klebsiella pneumoniae]|uniref:Uncharacterized protein n=1 Tax=Klebsiella pneumoniae TaxID=573 RepID=A0A377U387_KLEPN|nr:Uncharacterised protein [Klebsiella pneumoniae]
MHQMRQDGRLVAGTGADLQHPRLGVSVSSSVIRATIYGWEMVCPWPIGSAVFFPRFMFKGFINKLFARDQRDRLEDTFIDDALRAQLIQQTFNTFTYHCLSTPTRSSQSVTTSCA